MKIKLLTTLIIFLFIFPVISANNIDKKSDLDTNPPSVKIKIIQNSIIYEGDIIKCLITGNPNNYYWQINDVQPNDFYYVAIRQKGQELVPGHNEYMAFIGPVFIDNVFEE